MLVTKEKRGANAFADKLLCVTKHKLSADTAFFRKSRTLLDIVRPREPESRRCTWPTCPTRQKALCYRKNNCVYDIKCSPCGCHYIGSTTRPLHERIREHTTKGRGSTIHEHLIRCGGGTAQVEVRILA